jgi:hypothetical protein
MDDRFFRCYEEYKKERNERVRSLVETAKNDRFQCLVETERNERFRCLVDPKTSVIPSSPTSPLSPLKTEVVYYSTKVASPVCSHRLSFEERYKERSQSFPTSPLVLGERRRLNSTISLASEESFPSLPTTAKSTPTTPVLKAWSSVVLKNAEEGGTTQKKKPRVQSEYREFEEEEQEIVYDEDGFPRFR